MKRNLFLLIFLIGCNASDTNPKLGVKNTSQVTESANQQKNVDIIKPVLVKAPTGNTSEEDTVVATIYGRFLTLYPSGKITIRNIATNQSDSFHLTTELLVEKAYFLDYKNDLIIYYTETDNESGASYIEAYDRTNYTMKWKNRTNTKISISYRDTSLAFKRPPLNLEKLY